MPEFPRHLHKAGGLWIEVNDEAERDAKVAEGWSLEQVFEDADPPAVLDETVTPDAPKRGRPKKASA